MSNVIPTPPCKSTLPSVVPVSLNNTTPHSAVQPIKGDNLDSSLFLTSSLLQTSNESWCIQNPVLSQPPDHSCPSPGQHLLPIRRLYFPPASMLVVSPLVQHRTARVIFFFCSTSPSDFPSVENKTQSPYHGPKALGDLICCGDPSSPVTLQSVSSLVCVCCILALPSYRPSAYSFILFASLLKTSS